MDHKKTPYLDTFQAVKAVENQLKIRPIHSALIEQWFQGYRRR